MSTNKPKYNQAQSLWLQKSRAKKQRDEWARRQDMGVALIQRPLRLIRARLDWRIAKKAQYFANNGNGHMVKQIAREAL